VCPPVARATGDMAPFTSMLMLETTKLTEYIIEPFGRFADATVCEMFCNFRRSTVAEPPFGVSVIFSAVTRVLVVLLLEVVVLVAEMVLVVLVLVVVLGTVTNSCIAV